MFTRRAPPALQTPRTAPAAAAWAACRTTTRVRQQGYGESLAHGGVGLAGVVLGGRRGRGE